MSLNSVIFWGLLLSQQSSCSFVEWLTGSKKPEEFSDGGAPLLQIPFEELKPEEKFLIEASKITGLKLDQLDACQHKLIMKLKASCGSLSDEELAKLSVNLLNCQADVEGRKTYPCSQDMKLKECTSGMDAETWNAYHIMSNRARAVCYVARQEQFRALSEITVNRLVASARSHLQKMASINDSQDKLEKATELALERISRSQHDVLSTYSKLRRLESAFASALVSDKSSLEELGALIDNERNEITETFNNFKKSLEESESELKKQKDVMLAENKKILKDLLDTQELAEDLNQQLSKINAMNAENFEKSFSLFDASLKYLKNMNKSLNHVFSRLETLEELADNKTSLVLSYVGYAGGNVDTALLVAVHLMCLLLAMVISSFLELPRHLRLVLLVSGTLNTYLSVHGLHYATPLHLLYLTLAALAAVDLMVIEAFAFYEKKQSSKSVQRSFAEKKVLANQNGLKESRVKLVADWLTDENSKGSFDVLKNGTLPLTPLSVREADEMSERSKRSTRSRRAAASPSRSITGSSVSGRRTTCSAIRLNGMKCKLSAVPGLSTCRIHQEQR